MIITWSAPQSEQSTVPKEAHDSPLTLHDLQVALTTHPTYHATFQEKHFSTLLTKPLMTSGILTFTPPATMEKHILTPFEEIYVVEEEQVHFENPLKGISKTFFLDEHPLLQGISIGVRSALTGDFETLRHIFTLKVEGTKSQWALRLEPLDDSLAEVIDCISLTGHHHDITSINIHEPNGDYALMIIEKVAN